VDREFIYKKYEKKQKKKNGIFNFRFFPNPMAKNTYFISIHIGKFIPAHFEQFYVSTFFPKNLQIIPNLSQIVPKGPQNIPKHVQKNTKSVRKVSKKCPKSVRKVSEKCRNIKLLKMGRNEFSYMYRYKISIFSHRIWEKSKIKNTVFFFLFFFVFFVYKLPIHRPRRLLY
jgi:hypothetical protein